MIYKFKTVFIILIMLIYCNPSKSNDLEEKIEMLENYLSSIINMSFLFEQYSPNEIKQTGWMQIQKPNRLRIEYKGDNDLIIISNSAYLILYKAKDDIITSLPNEGPWTILTNNNLKFSMNKNNKEVDGIINDIKEFKLNDTTHVFYKISMKNKDKQLVSPIILHTSTKPFKINGWTIYNDQNEATKIKITNMLSINNADVDFNIFRLSEKDRLNGTIWKSPFKKSPIIHNPKYKN
jgi:outer membrane lipoprotein-sorting protein